MYLLTVRIRAFPADHAPSWHQHLTNHFFYIAEDRMTNLHSLSSRMMRNKYLKDLFLQWRGLTTAYDEGLMKGDAVLAAALWRNVCKADEEVDIQKLAQIVSYVRSVLWQLEKLEDDAVATGDVVFGDPGSEKEVVAARSRLMDAPLGLAGSAAASSSPTQTGPVRKAPPEVATQKGRKA
jgi:cytochrome b pre-mRNA-processing protein 3